MTVYFVELQDGRRGYALALRHPNGHLWVVGPADHDLRTFCKAVAMNDEYTAAGYEDVIIPRKSDRLPGILRTADIFKPIVPGKGAVGKAFERAHRAKCRGYGYGVRAWEFLFGEEEE